MLKQRIVILVDDGAATGASMLAAVRAARQLGPKRVVVALPVASASACELLSAEADELVCLSTPSSFHAVAEWYLDFTQTSSREVTELLAQSSEAIPASCAPRAPRSRLSPIDLGGERMLPFRDFRGNLCHVLHSPQRHRNRGLRKPPHEDARPSHEAWRKRVTAISRRMKATVTPAMLEYCNDSSPAKRTSGNKASPI